MSSHAPPPPAPAHHASAIASTRPAMTPAVAVAGVAGVAPPASVAPPAVPPFERIDLHDIKQQLHDALGEQGLPYWKSLKAYLLGQVGRSELQALVRGWLKPKNVHLHNQFLTALLHNASSPQFGHGPSSPLSMHKRRQGGGDALDFDTDPTFIEPRDRVRNWVMGMGGRERDRVRRSVNNEEDEDGESDKEGGAQEWDGAGVGKKRKWSVYQSNPQHPPLAQSSHCIPSSHQLGLRLSQVGKPYGLHISPEGMREIGEFMGVGLNQHLGDVLHSTAHLTGRDRPGQDTLRVPLGVKNTNVPDNPEPPLPTPDLHTLQYLFNMTPGLQPQASPTLYKLASSLTIGEDELNRAAAAKAEEASSRHPSVPPQLVTPSASAAPLPAGSQQPVSPVKAASTLHAAAGQGKMDAVFQTLADTGLLKLDKAGRHEGEEPKREKKHNLHWKYEDPAIILKDLLG